MANYKITTNEKFNSIEITFEGKPETETREVLKSLSFRWNPKKGCWYGFSTSEIIEQALNGGNVSADTITKANSKTSIRSLFERCNVETIPTHETRLPVKEIAKLTREHLKKQFPECGFSVRIGSGGWAANNEIIASITKSPYQKNSKALEAVLNYCECWLQSYNYDNSDYYTDYFDVNFYGNFKIDYSLVITEATEAIKADLTDFETKTEQAEQEKKEAEEIAYQKYIEERAEAEKAMKERVEREKIVVSNIEKHVVIDDLSEDNKFRLEGLAGGIGKEATFAELTEEIANSPELALQTAEVSRAIRFTDTDLYNSFCNMFLHDFSFLDGFGGTATDDSRVDNENFYKLNARQREEIKFYMCNCIAVYLNNDLKLIIDPEGYSYSRYVYIPTIFDIKPAKAETETAKEDFYFPEAIEKQVKVLKPGNVVTILYIDPWIITAEHITGTIESVKIADYAQYKNAAYIVIKTGKKTREIIIHDNTCIAIFGGVLGDVPYNLKYTDISDNMKQIKFSGADCHNYLINCIKYYCGLGCKKLVDTMQY